MSKIVEQNGQITSTIGLKMSKMVMNSHFEDVKKNQNSPIATKTCQNSSIISDKIDAIWRQKWPNFKKIANYTARTASIHMQSLSNYIHVANIEHEK